MLTKKLYLFLFMIVIAGEWNVYSVHTTLLLSSRLLGGGYGFNQENTSFGGKINLNIIPAMKWKENLLIPVYSLEYSGIKDVKELVGGGTLFQQYITNMFYIKPVFKISIIKLKPKVSVTSQLFKETKDEEWTKGLFDYYKTNFSVDLEFNIKENLKINLTPSIFYINFYNYKTLATEKYGQELSSVGRDILNFMGTELNVDFIISKVLKLSLYNLKKDFKDQYIIIETGEFSKEKRLDNMYVTLLNIKLPIKLTGPTSIFSSLEIKFTHNISNQNHYDVERVKYIPNYYNYNEVSFLPDFNFNFNLIPLSLQMLYQISYRKYAERLVQNEIGEYKDDKINSFSQYISLIVSFPILDKITGFIQQSYLVSNSNMKYEQVYRYNYSAYNILVGINFEY
ncbi:MAG: hypothetical protein N2643_04860 [Endomicrobia bacterium]|nr:hypothetical protein [Endomicrobiia bacterium]